ncbi:MAG TPA: hypothetical protein VJR92_11215 [Gemmatimonadaceae bacterium]|nr:hypothetical protein [Gemmatimonadaceae bacterium]
MFVIVAIIALSALTFGIGSLLRTQSEALSLPLDDLALRRREKARALATVPVRVPRRMSR